MMRDERHLHDTDPAKWRAYVAPRLAALFESDDDAAANQRWTQIAPDYLPLDERQALRAEVWPLLSAEAQAKIQRLRAAA